MLTPDERRALQGAHQQLETLHQQARFAAERGMTMDARHVESMAREPAAQMRFLASILKACEKDSRPQAPKPEQGGEA